MSYILPIKFLELQERFELPMFIYPLTKRVLSTTKATVAFQYVN
jgi:hypothetical protein